MAHEITGLGVSGREHPVGAVDQYHAFVTQDGQPFGSAQRQSDWGAFSPSYVTPTATDDRFAAGRPTWLPSIAAYRTPEEDWKAFQSQQQPFWSVRAPMRDVGQNLRSRYLLAAPAMAQQPGVQPTFERFLGDWRGTAGGADPALLRQRAWEAAAAATQPVGQYLTQYAPESEDWNRRAWLYSQFGSGAESAMANQLGVAQMLAVQRGPEAGGGVYRGQMADAIRNAMANLYQQRQNVGRPKESFLDWYLQQTGAGPTA
jgi:hypothetical protein